MYLIVLQALCSTSASAVHHVNFWTTLGADVEKREATPAMDKAALLSGTAYVEIHILPPLLPAQIENFDGHPNFS